MQALQKYTEERERFLREQFVQAGGEESAGIVLFPPFPPPLASTLIPNDGPTYPVNLADYANECFFMAYCSLSLRGLVSSQALVPIEEYQRDGKKLMTDLRGVFARKFSKTESSLTKLTHAEEKRLAALEKDAERIRFDLTTVSHVHPFDTGIALARARDKAESTETPGLKDYCTALLAAQFHPGLSLNQRQLLQEIAADYLIPAGAKAKLGADAPEYFLPAGAQVRWPANLPPEASAKLAIFREKRAALKAELAAAVAAAEASESEAKRTKHYEDLAAREAPAFAELETLAEEIRQLIAGLPYPDQPAPVAFPAALVDHMGAMLDHKSILVREVQRRAKDFSAELAPEHVEVAFEHNAASLKLLPAADATAKPTRNRNEILKRFDIENRELKRKFDDLATEMDKVRTELQRYHNSLPAGTAPDLNALSVEVARAGVAHRNWERYRDYRDAVLTPGLSPAQRRLLFNAAVVELEKYRLSLVN